MRSVSSRKNTSHKSGASWLRTINQIIKNYEEILRISHRTFEQCIVSVDAESEEEAVQKVQDAYNNSDIILDADNFSGEVIEIEPDQEFWRESEEDDSVALQHID
nr:MAG TPA: PcfM DpnD/PcfM-like protein [Caudoviricetes sp.]